MYVLDKVLVYIAIVFIAHSLYRDKIRPGFIFIIAISFLGIFKVLSPSEILAGLANEQILLIILLLILGDIYKQSAILEHLLNRIFKKANTYKGFIARMFAIIAPLSAFLNNTPLVAIMMPYAHSWGEQHKISPSKLLIPLSYAAILGGCITLIGTSTHLIVNSMVINQDIFPGLASLNLFDFFKVGFPMLIIGFIYLYLFGNKLLPDRGNVIDTFDSHQREYIV